MPPRREAGSAGHGMGHRSSGPVRRAGTRCATALWLATLPSRPVIFFDALAELDRARANGRLRKQDQVFVPLAIRRTAGPDGWEPLCRALEAIGAHVHVVPNLARICVVTLEEMNSGLGPPGAAS